MKLRKTHSGSDIETFADANNVNSGILTVSSTTTVVTFFTCKSTSNVCVRRVVCRDHGSTSDADLLGWTRCEFGREVGNCFNQHILEQSVARNLWTMVYVHR